MAIQPEKHEDGLDKDGEVHDSLGDVSYSKFQCHSLIQIIFEMTQFKMPWGTYDPFWLISRLNTGTYLSGQPRG